MPVVRPQTSQQPTVPPDRRLLLFSNAPCRLPSPPRLAPHQHTRPLGRDRVRDGGHTTLNRPHLASTGAVADGSAKHTPADSRPRLAKLITEWQTLSFPPPGQPPARKPPRFELNRVRVRKTQKTSPPKKLPLVLVLSETVLVLVLENRPLTADLPAFVRVFAASRESNSLQNTPVCHRIKGAGVMGDT